VDAGDALVRNEQDAQDAIRRAQTLGSGPA